MDKHVDAQGYDEFIKLTARRIDLNEEQVSDEAQTNKAIEELKAGLAQRSAHRHAEAIELDERIREFVEANRSVLIEKGKKFFRTPFGTYQFKKSSGGVKVKEGAENAVMQLALRLGKGKLVGKAPSRKLRLDKNMFYKFLDKYPSMRPLFGDYLVETPPGETLSLEPVAEVEYHGTKRKYSSTKAIPILKSSRPAEEPADTNE